MEADTYDSLMIRCPKLGGEVTFAYCRVEGGHLPCTRIVICWQACIPVAVYLEKCLTPDRAERFFGQRPKEKIATLIELIEAAKGDKEV